jgi:hypothetical protein
LQKVPPRTPPQKLLIFGIRLVRYVSTIRRDVDPTRGGFPMKTARIPVIAKLSLVLIPVLALLFCVCSAEAVDTLDQQLLDAAKSGDLG